MHKRLLSKTIHVGISTLLSRLFGIVREVLMVRYLGATGLSDAFLTAFKIPNSLRKIFAEGALSAAFVPTIVHIIKYKDQSAIAGLMTLGFIVFEGCVLLLCSLIMLYAHTIISYIAPGFSPEQIQNTIPMLYILMPLIFFISTSALLAGALQAIGHFFIPAIAPIVMNGVFIIGILVCMFYNLPVTYLCRFVLLGGVIQCILHGIIYIRLRFSYALPTYEDIKVFGSVLLTFLLCLPTISVMEIALFIDTSFASLLPPGSISLLFYANRFAGIPLGVFAVAFSTIILPHLSYINSYTPRRLHFYLLESAKLIFWITIPVALLMAFFSHNIFETIFLSEKFTLAHVYEASAILRAFLCGLFSFSLNKILLNIFYSMHAAWIPALISLCVTLINIVLNILFIEKFQTVGLAYATTCSSIIQMLLFIVVLYKKYQFRLFWKNFIQFVIRYLVQLTLYGSTFVLLYSLCTSIIINYMPPVLVFFLLKTILLWFWVGILTLLIAVAMWYSRKKFGIYLYFLGR